MRNVRIKLCLALLFLGSSLLAGAKFRVKFVVTQLPAYHQQGSPIFVAGSFNGWNPGAKEFQFSWVDGKYGLVLSLPKGVHAFKLTQGSWESAESLGSGIATDNHTFILDSDTTIPISVEHWADHFPKPERMHSSGSNVHVLDTAFFIPQLNRYRRVWIYLPADYAQSSKNYPVLYMHDGQNLFDTYTSGFGEWGIDEALDTLGPLHREVIVVGIDHGGDKRLNEYAPFDMEKYGKGEGAMYVDFLVKTLKPYIDKHYRTLRRSSNTFIAGSSMGGLISFYAITKYPKVFGGAGVFSPAFWINPQLKQVDKHTVKKCKGKIYFFAGRQESETMVTDMLAVFESMRVKSKAKMKTVIHAEGKHNEATWRAVFPDFFKWVVPAQ